MTRALISAATSLHIQSLRAVVKAGYATAARARQATDAATVAVSHAENTLATAKVARAEAGQAERNASRAADNIYRAANAEAQSLRRGAVVG